VNLWMDWITETPDENQRRRHDNLVCVVDTVIKGQTLPNGHCDDAFDHWVPINARNCSLFTELQISERLKLLWSNKHIKTLTTQFHSINTSRRVV